MKKFLLPLLAILFLTACEKESTTDLQPDQEIEEIVYLTPAPKIDVCHYDAENDTWHVINISENAWPVHAGHGDVQLIDTDGDGWVTSENECGVPVDCDDADAELTDNCFPMNDVQNPTTGKIWMDRNLGASQVATSSTDADAYGDLYQWGRGTDGHQIRTSGTTSTLSNSDTPGHGNFISAPNPPDDWRSPQNDMLWQGVNGVNNPCPPGYRLPTEAELDAERASWGSSNAAGAFASPLKLPVAGFRDVSDGSLNFVGSFGIYWSSTVVGTYSGYLLFDSSFAGMFADARAYGFSVRCLKD